MPTGKVSLVFGLNLDFISFFPLRPRRPQVALDAIVEEAQSIPGYLPNVVALRDAARKAKEWTAKVEALQVRNSWVACFRDSSMLSSS